MICIKRDGREVEFKEERIENAVALAYLDVHPGMEEEAHRLGKSVASSVRAWFEEIGVDKPTVEQIQDVVEEHLSASYFDVAKKYILYRDTKSKKRESKNDMLKMIEEKAFGLNDEKKNANVDEKSFGGRFGEVAETILRELALKMVSKTTRENHENNMVYTHDFAHYPLGDHNCLTIPIDPLMKNGFNTRQVDIRPPKTFGTFGQLSAVLAQLQSLQQFGGVSYGHYDHSSVPYVRMSFLKHYNKALDFIGWIKPLTLENVEEVSITDKIYRGHWWNLTKRIRHRVAMTRTKEEIHQAIEALFHNLNSLQSRSGNQLPFSSLNYGTCTLEEGRMVTKAILEVSIDGLGKHGRTSVFPCQIFQVGEGINKHPGDPNYDLFRLALKSTAKRLYPNYANVDWSNNEGYDKNDPNTYFGTMGCRTANLSDINAEPGQNPQLKDGRGNICPVTIILPTLAMMAKEKAIKNGFGEAKGDCIDPISAFMELLDTKIHEAKDQLIERFEYICSQSPSAAEFMYENNVMFGYKSEEGIRSALKHGTLAIGQLGLAEALQILIGCDHTEERGMELAKRIEQLFKDRCNEFKHEYKLNFGVYYTPAENLCYTAMQKFKRDYGVIPNVSDKDFFTNSMHIPVWKEISPFEKIDLESQLTGYSSAGCITYVELESSVANNLKALEQLVVYAMDKDVPYFAVNIPNDHCEDCGYTDEIGECCPKCGSKIITRLRRVTGYLTADYKKAFHKGKQQEVKMRYKHSKKLRKK